jgi:predicted naringenin-chalcone synthase
MSERAEGIKVQLKEDLTKEIDKWIEGKVATTLLHLVDIQKQLKSLAAQAVKEEINQPGGPTAVSTAASIQTRKPIALGYESAPAGYRKTAIQQGDLS